MLTIDECRKMISKVAWEIGVSPKLISTRLLSNEDKKDMINGDLPYDSLLCHAKVWKEQGLRDCASGKFDRYSVSP